jgi:hypothetical protein
LILSALGFSVATSFAAETERIRNDKIVVWGDNLIPGESVSVSSAKPGLIVCLGAGTVELTPRSGARTTVKAEPATVKFEPSGIEKVTNSGNVAVRLLRVEFNTEGSQEHWGRTGLSFHYKVLLENEYVRVYDIFIPANSNEPQHTHKDRIVVCLSGAELTHLFPDGRTEVSTLRTGEIVWRKGSTHIGQNHSANDFHAIAIEPK